MLPTYKEHVETPTASETAAVNVDAVPAVAVVGVTEPTVGAVVSVDEDDAATVIDVTVPLLLFPAASTHVAFALNVPLVENV